MYLNISMSKSSHYDTARLVIAFLAVALMAGMFLIFYNNSDNIIKSNQLSLFIMLAVIAGGLLIGLFYIVSNQSSIHKAHPHKSTSRKKRSSR